MNLRIEGFADGIIQVNQAYIERDFTRDDYLIMVCVYLITALLKTIKQEGSIGFYENYREVGYYGWLTINDKTLFFAPTKAIILDTQSDEISPIGNL